MYSVLSPATLCKVSSLVIERRCLLALATTSSDRAAIFIPQTI